MVEKFTNTYEYRPLYEPISLELDAQDIDEAMRLYMEFIELPHEEKKKYHFLDPEKARTSEAGYMHKGELSPDRVSKQDNKHVFHYSQELRRVANEMPRYDQPQVAREFIDCADYVYDSLAQSVREKYLEWQEDIPWLVGMHFPKDGVLRNHLRFLAYQQNTDGMLATGHYDKGTATVAVAESHGGLRLGVGEEDIAPAERDSFDPIIFGGYGWHQVHEIMDAKTDLKAAWHDVVDLKQPISDDVTRWALIYFVNPAKLYLESTQEQTHTPIRWRNVGKVAMPYNGEHSFLTGEVSV